MAVSLADAVGESWLVIWAELPVRDDTQEGRCPVGDSQPTLAVVLIAPCLHSMSDDTRVVHYQDDDLQQNSRAFWLALILHLVWDDTQAAHYQAGGA